MLLNLWLLTTCMLKSTTKNYIKVVGRRVRGKGGWNTVSFITGRLFIENIDYLTARHKMVCEGAAEAAADCATVMKHRPNTRRISASRRETGAMKEEEAVGADIDDVCPSPQYNVLSDNLRRCAPSGLQCTMFCGGRNCKYETPESWDSAHMAIRGIYSHWVTDDILAMARPCTEIINKRNVIKQFQSLGVRSLLNLQEPWEHNYCGCPLEPSGFTYDPAIFMDNGIYYYNYAWQDYGEVKVTRLLDMVKIMCHGLSEGRLAIHCHAGLGRTGVLIACFLVYNMRFRANEAIRFVRLKRPNSVQSRGQILCVQNFERLLLKQPKIPEVTLPHYILTQKIMLHGFEARCIQHIPKIMYVVCERLLQLCGCDPVATIPMDHHAPTTMHFLAANKNPSHYHHIKNLLNICSKMKATNQPESSNTGE
ncbi:Protein tyrosine phosphatase domain-containing protein 1 [Homalodisca vitripennis]|nr:Protein tyrosine phosphatase domain-containing protein 1 [Homalodisca vitripennis]